MKLILAFFTFGCSFIVNAQVTSNLAAQYKFNGNVNDEKAGNHGNAYNCLYTADKAGNPASAIYIQGTTNSFVKLSNAAALKPAAGAISLWVNVDEVNNLGTGFDYNPIILAKNDATKSGYFEGYCLYMKRSDKKFLTITTRKSNNAERYIFANSAATLDNWHHLVMCYNFDSLWFYVDNLLQNKVARSFDQEFDAGDSVLLGISKVTNNDRFFTGAIDELRIYKNILSSKQVDTLFKMNFVSDVKELPITNFNQFMVYPNPSNGIVYFNPAIDITRFEVYDPTGKKVSEGTAEKCLELLNFKGLYMIRCYDSENNSRIEKLLLQ